MNLTQEKLILFHQVNAVDNETLIKILSEIDHVDEKDLMHSFLQNMIRFFKNKDRKFYTEVRNHYDINDLIFYDPYEMDDGDPQEIEYE